MRILDARFFLCPVPLLMTKQALSPLKKGEQLWVKLNKMSQISDFELLCEAQNCSLKEVSEQENEICILIEK